LAGVCTVLREDHTLPSRVLFGKEKENPKIKGGKKGGVIVLEPPVGALG